MRRFFSTSPLPPAAALLRSSLERASLLTRTPILLCDNASAQAPAFVQRHLDASPGQRCLVLTPPTSTRAAPLLHYLRRGGYFPLTVELPDTAPNAAHALAAISAARRTGVSFVVGVGSSSTLSVARAVAALLPNGGSAMDYAGNLGGTAELRQPSLPLLSVPTCPSGLELCRQSLLLVEGHALAELRSHPQSLQAALIDPSLAASLAGEAALTTAWSALAHALEAYTRADSGRAGRELAWAALELAARALLPALAAGASSPPRHKAAALPAAGAGAAAAAAAAAAPSPATLLAASSALVSAALAEGPLGPCRGVALSIATRYAIPYATALLAVTPKVFGEPAARTLGAYEEIAREMEASVQQQQQESGEAALAAGKEWEWEAGKGAAAAGSSTSSSSSSSRRRGGGVLPSPQGFGAAAGSSSKRQRAAKRSGEEGELARREAEEDQELMRLAYEAREEMGGGSEGEAGAPEPPRPLPSQYSASQEVPLGEGEEDSELIRAARRYAHVGALLKDALGAQQQQGAQQLLVPWAPLAEVEGRVRLDAAGRELGGGLEGSLRALSGAGAALAKVSSGAPRLEDYGLSEADFAAIAEMAEVDANTLTALMALKKRDLVEMLQES